MGRAGLGYRRDHVAGERLHLAQRAGDHAQGAAIGGGGLWIARSDWNWGTLDRLNPVTGALQRRYEIAPGRLGLEQIDPGDVVRQAVRGEIGRPFPAPHAAVIERQHRPNL
jgi:hypothetical protein